MHTTTHKQMLVMASSSFMDRRTPESTPSEREIDILNAALHQIRLERPDIFHNVNSLKTRKFFHKPTSKVPHESYVTDDRAMRYSNDNNH